MDKSIKRTPLWPIGGADGSTDVLDDEGNPITPETPGGDEGVRNLREQLRREREEREAATRQLQELQEREQTRATEERQNALVSALSEAGFSEKLAGLYPADNAPSVEAVKAWAAEAGIEPVRRDTDSGLNDVLSRYERLTSHAVQGAQPGSDDEIEELHNEALRQIGQSLRPEGGLNPSRPTKEDMEKKEALNRRINQLNREQGREVEMGRRQPYTPVYGGLMDPPAWAAVYRRDN